MTYPITPVTKPVGISFDVYADYDGNAPDSHSVLSLASLELADIVREIIRESYDYLCVVDGFEWAKSWKIRETIAYTDQIATSLEQAKEWLGEPEEQEESCYE